MTMDDSDNDVDIESEELANNDKVWKTSQGLDKV